VLVFGSKRDADFDFLFVAMRWRKETRQGRIKFLGVEDFVGARKEEDDRAPAVLSCRRIENKDLDPGCTVLLLLL